jgi:hypothetical protein
MYFLYVFRSSLRKIETAELSTSGSVVSQFMCTLKPAYNILKGVLRRANEKIEPSAFHCIFISAIIDC